MRLQNFQKWLLATGRAVSTCGVYTSTVRSALRAIGVTPTDQDVFDYHLSLPKERRAGFRNAWKVFAEYLREHGQTIACPVFPTGRWLAVEKHVYEEGLAVLLDAGVKADFLTQLRWYHLRRDGTDAGFVVEISTGRPTTQFQPWSAIEAILTDRYEKDEKGRWRGIDPLHFVFLDKETGLGISESEIIRIMESRKQRLAQEKISSKDASTIPDSISALVN